MFHWWIVAGTHVLNLKPGTHHEYGASLFVVQHLPRHILSSLKDEWIVSTL